MLAESIADRQEKLRQGLEGEKRLGIASRNLVAECRAEVEQSGFERIVGAAAIGRRNRKRFRIGVLEDFFLYPADNGFIAGERIHQLLHVGVGFIDAECTEHALCRAQHAAECIMDGELQFLHFRTIGADDHGAQFAGHRIDVALHVLEGQ